MRCWKRRTGTGGLCTRPNQPRAASTTYASHHESEARTKFLSTLLGLLSALSGDESKNIRGTLEDVGSRGMLTRQITGIAASLVARHPSAAAVIPAARTATRNILFEELPDRRRGHQAVERRRRRKTPADDVGGASAGLRAGHQRPDPGFRPRLARQCESVAQRGRCPRRRVPHHRVRPAAWRPSGGGYTQIALSKDASHAAGLVLNVARSREFHGRQKGSTDSRPRPKSPAGCVRR